VLEAAVELFVRDGYLRTTMKGIATAAGVSVETVYAQGSKQALLLAGVDRALAGDEEPVAMAARTPFVDALAEPSALDLVEGFVGALVDVADRSAALLVAFEDAAAADATTAELWAEAEQHRRQDYRRLVQAVADLGGLREGLDVDSATDGMWTTFTPRMAHHVAGLGWPRDRRVAWVSRALAALLLPPSSIERQDP
jgi:AcrR family transcriptional regulator